MSIPKNNTPTLCPECDGEGYMIYSCCGDDMMGADLDICPTCQEHTSMDEEICEECNGEGTI